MPGQFHKRRWIFGGFSTDPFRWAGARFYGLIWGRYCPLLAVAIDDSWYEASISISLCIVCMEFGFFIEFERATPFDGGSEQ